MTYLYIVLIFVLLILLGIFNFRHTMRSASRLLRRLADDL